MFLPQMARNAGTRAARTMRYLQQAHLRHLPPPLGRVIADASSFSLPNDRNASNDRIE
jgi:hypothetical protein